MTYGAPERPAQQMRFESGPREKVNIAVLKLADWLLLS
jgi:hypothetical protein